MLSRLEPAAKPVGQRSMEKFWFYDMNDESIICERICLGQNSHGTYENNHNLKFQEVVALFSIVSR